MFDQGLRQLFLLALVTGLSACATVQEPELSFHPQSLLTATFFELPLEGLLKKSVLS